MGLALASSAAVRIWPRLTSLTLRCMQSERGRKHAEAELGEMSVRVNELSITVTNLNNDKRRLEGDLANLQAELEEALTARRAAEDRADRAQLEVNRLTEELRQVNFSLLTT